MSEQTFTLAAWATAVVTDTDGNIIENEESE